MATNSKKVSLRFKEDILRKWCFKGLFRPHDVIYHRGKYIMTDTGHRLITSYDPETGSHETVCKIRGSWLYGLAPLSDPNMGFLVADSSRGRVYRISNAGQKYDWGLGLKAPTGITVHKGEAFVADYEANFIAVYTEAGKYIRRFGYGHLVKPWFMAVNSKDHLYVADSQNINVFTTSGDYVDCFKITTNGRTWRYRGIAIDRYDNVYVTARDTMFRGATETITVLDSKHDHVTDFTAGMTTVHYLRGLCINYKRNELVVVDGEWHRLKLLRLYE